MSSETLIACEVDEILYAWRARVLNILLVCYSVILLVPLSALLIGWGLSVPWSLRSLCVLIYLVLLVATLRPRWKVQIRGGILLGMTALMGTLQLAVGQLAGHGRIALMVMPFLALLLLGPWAGWAALVGGAVLFALVPYGLHLGWFSAWGGAMAGFSAPPSYWVLQWILWLIAMLILMILFTRFQTLQRRTMIAERLALRQLEKETADRQRLEMEIGRIGEEERRRLGAELHDGLCQRLTAALLESSALEKMRTAGGVPDVASLTQLRVSIGEAIGMAYDVAQGVCPVDMDPAALLPALERLCREVRDRHGLDCRLQADGNVVIRNPEHTLHLYRIVREAVSNAIKHAQCAHIRIALEHANSELVVQVIDDGAQTAPGVTPVAGLGLSLMSYRAGLIGGSLQVVGGENGGMRVTCRVPGLGDPS